VEHFLNGACKNYNDKHESVKVVYKILLVFFSGHGKTVKNSLIIATLTIFSKINGNEYDSDVIYNTDSRENGKIYGDFALKILVVGVTMSGIL